MKIKTLTLTLLLALLFSVIAGVRLVNKADANFMNGTPLPYLPVITIGSDGSISPANASISKNGTVYTLAGNIVNYSIEIKCNNITVDGAGFILQASSPYEYAPSSGITVSSSGVTVQNMNIPGHVTGILVLGSRNVIAQNSIGSGIEIRGNYNSIIRNTVANPHDSAIYLGGNYNKIVGNFMHGHGIFMADSSFNTIAGNTIEQCTNFAVKPSNETNLFYLNKFINNTNLPGLLIPAQKSSELNLAKLLQTHISPFRWESIPKGWKAIYPDNAFFDNGSLGNYWSDYSGTDSNGDGIGDTPFIIGGNLQDRYPLMAPVDITSAKLELSEPDWVSLLPLASPSPFPPTSSASPSLSQEEPFPTTTVAGVMGAIALVITSVGFVYYFKKRNLAS